MNLAAKEERFKDAGTIGHFPTYLYDYSFSFVGSVQHQFTFD